MRPACEAARLRGFVGQQCLENWIVGSEDYLVARHEDSRCPEDVLGHFAVDGKLTQSDATGVVETCSAFCGDAGASDVLALFLGWLSAGARVGFLSNTAAVCRLSWRSCGRSSHQT